MSDEVKIGAQSYISSKRAAELSRYAQDYIGQLARASLIDAQRIGGLWYVSLDSLNAYRQKSEAYKPQPPKAVPFPQTDSVVSFDGRDYVSASRAAQITSYHQDYVGQLARSGSILARQVGNRWYVDREGLLTHKKEKDALLAAVQAQSVGVNRVTAPTIRVDAPGGFSIAPEGPFYTYMSDAGDLMPVLREKSPASFEMQPTEEEEYAVPIRVDHRQRPQRPPTAGLYVPRAEATPQTKVRYKGYLVHLIGATLTVVIVLTFGFATFQKHSILASGAPVQDIRTVLLASAQRAFSYVGNRFEIYLAPELFYQRGMH